MSPEVHELIELYGFQPLPVEGTLFTQTYQSAKRLPGGGPVGTAILGLYCDDPPSVSRFHRLTADETWHFHAGDPFRLILLFPDGSSRDLVFGRQVLAGHRVQFTVPAGVWMAAHLIEGGHWALYGCTMAPGFEESMFEGGDVETLLPLYPERAGDIRRLACPHGVKQMPPTLKTAPVP